MAEKPLMLKDFLELDCESSSDGFRCYPRRLGDAAPVRHLLDAELRPGSGRSPIRSPSARAALAKLSGISRSLSRRLRGGFWKPRGEEEEEIDEAAPCGGAVPAPVVSSCSGSESDTETDSDFSERHSASEFAHSSAASSQCLADVAAAAGDEQKALRSEPLECGVVEMDDKEQLSPVSVMDFPFEDDDSKDDEDELEEEALAAAAARLPSFQESLAHLQKTKMQLLHKIRRFEGLADLGPIDLDARFAASSESSQHSDDQHPHCSLNPDDDVAEARNLGDEQQQQQEEETEECRLLGLLKATASMSTDAAAEKLLLDFFAEGRRPDANAGEEAELLLGAAREWVEGEGAQWSLRDVLCGEAAAAAVERCGGGRWLCADEEEREAGAGVEGWVFDELVEELVMDLVA